MALEHVLRRFEEAVQRGTTARRERLARAAGVLDALSPMKVLSRGYAMATDDRGMLLKSVSRLKRDEQIELRLTDGRVKCRVDEVLIGAGNGRKEDDV